MPAHETTNGLRAAGMDDGPLTAEDIAHIRKVVEPMLPKGKVISARSLLQEENGTRSNAAPENPKGSRR